MGLLCAFVSISGVMVFIVGKVDRLDVYLYIMLDVCLYAMYVY